MLYSIKPVFQLKLNYQLIIEVLVDKPGLSNKVHNCLPYTSTLKMFVGRYHHLTLPYRVLLTTMTNNICMQQYCCHNYFSYLETT